jgi:hypothetical protein
MILIVNLTIINQSIFVMENCVFLEVRSEFLNVV